jgi:Tetratricopeptide repeat
MKIYHELVAAVIGLSGVITIQHAAFALSPPEFVPVHKWIPDITFLLPSPELDEAIRLNPNNAKAYYNRGFAQFLLGNIQAAITDYNEVIRLNPELAY